MNTPSSSDQSLANEILSGLNEIESLEKRRVPAFVSAVFDPVAHVLTVNFSKGADDILLQQNEDGAYLSWTGRGGESSISLDESYPGIEGIVINAGGGKDTIGIENIDFGDDLNLAADTIVVNGGAGDDSIVTLGYSGPSQNTVKAYGEAGNDVLDFSQSLAGATLDGGVGMDVITSGLGSDLVVGGDGNDGIFSKSANGVDTVYAGNGDDGISIQYSAVNTFVDGGAGNDTLSSQGFLDTLIGGDGNDLIFGGFGADSIVGGEGDDLIAGNAGIDTIEGGGGDDYIVANFIGDVGDSLGDLLSGGDGNDSVYGGVGADTIDGGDGEDTLIGGRGTDSVYGGEGDDLLHVLDPLARFAVPLDTSNDTLDGGLGVDVVSWENAAFGVDVGINGTFDNTCGGTDSVFNFEGVMGSNYDDTLTGDAGGNPIGGGQGDDLLEGGDGNDTLVGGDGLDVVNGQAGFDSMLGGNQNDSIVSDVAGDVVNGNAGKNTLVRESVDAVTKAKAKRIRFVVDDF